MESSFVRFQETRRGRAQVSKAESYLFSLFADTAIELNNVKAWKMT